MGEGVREKEVKSEDLAGVLHTGIETPPFFSFFHWTGN